MTENNGYFIGIRRNKSSPYPYITGIKTSKCTDDFKSLDAGESKLEGKQEVKGPEGFESVAKAFFDSMLGSLDVMYMSGMALNITQSIIFQKFEENEIVPVSLAREEIDIWDVHKIAQHAVPRTLRKIGQVSRQFDNIDIHYNVFLLGLVSQYDAYLGRLIKQLARHKSEIVIGSQKTFSAADILKLGDLDAFKESILEKEVEGVLRSGHQEQMKWLENKVGVPLTKNLKIWPEFIEICERRNLFAHTDGYVSATYLEKCAQAGIQDLPQLGDKLEVSRSYLERAAEVLLELGIKLSQVLWRVSVDDPAAHERADSVLNEFAYELLYHERCSLSASLLEFAFLPHLKHPRKSIVLMMRVNLANAYRILGDLQKRDSCLSQEDWETLQPSFRICAAAVREDLEEVVRLIPSVPAEEIAASDYFEWPVFSSLKANEDFIGAVRQKFGEEVFSVVWRDSDAAISG